MIRVAGQRFCGVTVEALYVQQFADQPFFMQVDNRGGNAAQREIRVNIAAAHFVFQKTGYCQRGAAGSGLQREAFLEIA
ncbi:Uncharacterised protein [Citrobacter koseri]|uniref:Uncharacterized protein n=1 Tax=Citrobacter koseri TaxID=545 RepID=A0A2X2V6E4_CITKO|nr:Uncharacterised protein [Citrobacter koseri]